MSLRLEMMQVARLAPGLLGDAVGLVRAFLRGQQNSDGGFKDRAGKSDLYYTVFWLDALIALETASTATESSPEGSQEVFSKCATYLRPFGMGDGLDFVHLCCLARGWAAVADQVHAEAAPVGIRAELARRVEGFRARDGGYNPMPGSAAGTAYGAFLALGAYQDAKVDLPDPLRLVQSLKFLETTDGAWANERPVALATNPRAMAAGSTNATAAAVTVLRNLGQPINPAVGDWLLARAHAQGGFLAMPFAPIPDLLSTATTLHALAGLQRDFSALKESCLDYIDTLWTNEGSFHGHWQEEHLDTEYTFYGLLALGHLSY